MKDLNNNLNKDLFADMPALTPSLDQKPTQENANKRNVGVNSLRPMKSFKRMKSLKPFQLSKR